MRSFTLAALASAVFGRFAGATLPSQPYELHEARDAPLKSWVPRERLDQGGTLPVQIHLKQPNVANGIAELMDISDPRSRNYGKHWSKEDVLSAFQPQQHALDTVQAWLASVNLTQERVTYSPGRALLAFHAKVSEVEALLQTTYYDYVHSESGARSPGCDEYYLPRHVREHIDFISPSLSLHSRKLDKRRRRARSVEEPSHLLHKRTASASNVTLANCSNYVVPQCIQTLYNIPPFNGTVSQNNTMGIFNAQQIPLVNASYSQTDLDSFFANFDSSIPQGTHPIAASVNGGVVEVDDPQYEGEEPMLDYSIAYPIIYPQTITAFVSNDTFKPPLDASDEEVADTGVERFLDAIDSSFCTGASANGTLQCGAYNVTNVLSVSYEYYEDEINYSYAVRVCNEIMKLSLQGVTVVAASGDYGVGQVLAHPCAGEDRNVFTPQWWSTCPFITSVGGTQIKPGADVSSPGSEEAWYYSPSVASGGGFSNYYPMPSYQNASVTNYLNTANLSFTSYAQLVNTTNTTLGQGSTGVFNRIGRAYPDVSAVAQNITIFSGGKLILADGTSAPTPLWGAIITRINEERLAAGKGPVGFINPVLYQNPDAMNDIVQGQNLGCDGKGFPAQKGWDPVTGLGSPNYPKLLEVFMSLP